MAGTLKHVSELLDGVARVAREDLSPFASERADLSAYESRMLLSLVDVARRRMLAALDQLGLDPPRPTISSRWSITTALLFADIALSELESGVLRGYGDLTEVAESDVRAVAAELRALLRRGTALLSADRRQQLDEWIAATRGMAARVLREVRSILDANGLVELYPNLEAVAERAASPVSDLGVFGRISAGKSSLVNALVGADVLPVSAVPVTTVPLRIQRGEGGLVARFEDGRIEQLPLDSIASLVAERENPENRKGVASVEAYVPGAPPGLRLLDTPGVAAFTGPTSATAFSWLARCDLGLVLVPAASAVDREDWSLVAGLAAAGVEFRILLSKADLLSPEELEATTAYVRDALARRTGLTGVEVHPVSTQDGGAGLGWLRAAVLEPLVSSRAVAARTRLRWRLHHLVAATEAALGEKASGDRNLDLARARRLDEARSAVSGEVDRLGRNDAALLEDGLEPLLEAWRSGRDGTEVVRELVARRAGAALAAVRGQLARVAAGGPDGGDLSEAALPPLFDATAIADLPDLAPLRARLPVLTQALARRGIASATPPAHAALADYAARLRRWADVMIDRLRDLAVAASARPGGAPSLEHLHRWIDAAEDGESGPGHAA